MESPLEIWLAEQCERIPGANAGFAVIGESAHSPAAMLARWPARAALTPRLQATVESARHRGRVTLQEPVVQAGTPPHPPSCVAVPVLRDGLCVGAIGVSLRTASTGAAKQVADDLTRGLRSLETLLALESERDRLVDLVPLLGCLFDHQTLPRVAHALASSLAGRLDCERVSVGLRQRDSIRIVGLSTSVDIAEETDAIRDLRHAMEEAVEQDTLVEVPAAGPPPGHETLAHEHLLRSTEGGYVVTLPLAARGRAVGALTCEWSRTRVLDDLARERLRVVGSVAAPVIALLARAEATAGERARRWIDAQSERLFGTDSRVAKLAACGVAALLISLTFLPADYRVSADATLEGRIQRALVAPIDGYLGEAHARAGDLVKRGQVLARLDDRDLELERRKWLSKMSELQNEYREALASQDRIQVSILRAQIDKAAAETALVEELLGRTEVVAPFDGIVLKGDLDRVLGSPVEQGAVLFEIAPLDGYRIIVEVDERDIADVRVGQSGRLMLSALPDHPLALRVERITPISTSLDGRNYFRAEAVLEEPLAALRPGMKGIAKIDAGRRRFIWIWTHELLDWLRLALWAFLP
ncbi:MAG: HlyD family efflux transporter periplasmic adaptor subunit [Deltaproteobacteria bacterium]|nr:HlyD family efflux transporter periplasmic adaptor subunit [Deltaproteobacteria bacterium]